MLKGQQIRRACQLLGWDAVTLGDRAKVTVEVALLALLAEQGDALPNISIPHAVKIQDALESAGVRFGRNGAVVRVATDRPK